MSTAAQEHPAGCLHLEHQVRRFAGDIANEEVHGFHTNSRLVVQGGLTDHGRIVFFRSQLFGKPGRLFFLLLTSAQEGINSREQPDRQRTFFPAHYGTIPLQVFGEAHIEVNYRARNRSAPFTWGEGKSSFAIPVQAGFAQSCTRGV